MSSRIERLRNFFLIAFFLLVITIIFTPLLVRSGFSLFTEETLESALLLLQVSIAWKIFRLYERSVNQREKDVQRLEGEYQKREKELLEAFAYLGKVNVQVSLIKSFLQKLKTPGSRKEVENYIKEILEIALTLSGKQWVTLRALDSKTLQTVSEYWTKSDVAVDTRGIKIGNKDVISWGQNRKIGKENGFFVFGSTGSNISSLKVFLVFLNGEKIDPDIEVFLQAAVNQCEVLLTMFDLKSNIDK